MPVAAHEGRSERPSGAQPALLNVRVSVTFVVCNVIDKGGLSFVGGGS
jgi:hypothetical protein